MYSNNSDFLFIIDIQTIMFLKVNNMTRSGSILAINGQPHSINRSYGDLKGADLIGDNLSRADLSGADLTGADLTVAILRGADLSGANLTYANLSGAILRGADLAYQAEKI